jgi:hypothetical protein
MTSSDSIKKSCSTGYMYLDNRSVQEGDWHFANPRKALISTNLLWLLNSEDNIVFDREGAHEPCSLHFVQRQNLHHKFS